ncbi:MAG: peroxide stress protein YaaA [Rubrivivax sp.]|nr:peroxide stress protein YaaA [Rubrivivax sp.]
MLYLLSPAKRLDYETPVPAAVRRKATDPLFIDRAAELIEVLRRQTPAQVAALMELSDDLTALNVARYAAWQPQPAPQAVKPAVLAFDGDVYEGLQARTLGAADLTWAQRHLVILSGLYGVLRPLDRLQPYRLEMGSPLRTRHGKDLYAYWGDTLAQWLHQQLQAQRTKVLVNLASVEYARAALRPALSARVIDCVFEDGQPGAWKVVSFFAKRARGRFARWAIDGRIDRPSALTAFDADGYAYDPGVSTPDRLVFRRRSA